MDDHDPLFSHCWRMLSAVFYHIAFLQRIYLCILSDLANDGLGLLFDFLAFPCWIFHSSARHYPGTAAHLLCGLQVWKA